MTDQIQRMDKQIDDRIALRTSTRGIVERAIQDLAKFLLKQRENGCKSFLLSDHADGLLLLAGSNQLAQLAPSKAHWFFDKNIFPRSQRLQAQGEVRQGGRADEDPFDFRIR